MSHTITENNYLDAEAAIRDILFMYQDLIHSYRGFGHNIEVGRFDPFTFVDADVYEKPGYTLAVDIGLLHQGSAVALLCHLSDFWDEDGTCPTQWEWGKSLQTALDSGRVDHLPLAKAALLAGLESEDELRSLLPEVYAQYVRGYFERLLQQG